MIETMKAGAWGAAGALLIIIPALYFLLTLPCSCQCTDYPVQETVLYA